MFGAWLPSARTDELLHAAVAAGRGANTLAAAHALLEATRARGYSHLAADHQVGGIEAAAAPVFNFRNDVTMALIVVGVAGSIDLGASSPALTALRDAAAQLSARLGARAD
ncbi:bacterial transcriptional regulator [mine drainage metagenome]|uniref:Bacterial transcriptional regulator n=1 Tax=mine drainage metagenome TaxID=410659 RepID=A0A1J5Q7K5_9ZZZZ